MPVPKDLVSDKGYICWADFVSACQAEAPEVKYFIVHLTPKSFAQLLYSTAIRGPAVRYDFDQQCLELHHYDYETGALTGIKVLRDSTIKPGTSRVGVIMGYWSSGENAL